MRRLQQWILPVGIPLAIALALLFPAAGQYCAQLRLGPFSWVECAVVLIFLCSGYALTLADLRLPPGFAADALRCWGVNLLLMPLLVAAVHLLPVRGGWLVGLVVMAAVPTTLSSALVIATANGGERMRALLLTLGCVLLGAFSAPLAVAAHLGQSQGIRVGPLLSQLSMLVLLPLASGFLLRRLLRRAPPGGVGMVPSVAVLAVVWASLASRAAVLQAVPWAELLGLLVLVQGLHLLQWGSLCLLSRGQLVARRLPVVVVGGQKSLPVALSLLVLIARQQETSDWLPVAVLVCVAWHAGQLLVDSCLAAWMARGAGVGILLPECEESARGADHDDSRSGPA